MSEHNLYLTAVVAVVGMFLLVGFSAGGFSDGMTGNVIAYSTLADGVLDSVTDYGTPVGPTKFRYSNAAQINAKQAQSYSKQPMSNLQSKYQKMCDVGNEVACSYAPVLQALAAENVKTPRDLQWYLEDTDTESLAELKVIFNQYGRLISRVNV